MKVWVQATRNTVLNTRFVENHKFRRRAPENAIGVDSSSRPHWTAPRFSRVETQYSALVTVVRRHNRRVHIAESYNDRLIGRAPNNWCVARVCRTNHNNSASLRRLLVFRRDK